MTHLQALRPSRARVRRTALHRTALGLTAFAAAGAVAVTAGAPADATTAVVPHQINAYAVHGINAAGSTVSVDQGGDVSNGYRTTVHGTLVPLPGNVSEALVTVEALNNAAWSTGEVAPPVPQSGPTLPARWSTTGQLKVLGHSSSHDADNPISYTAKSINTHRTVVGDVSYPSTINRPEKAVRWSSAGTLSTIGSRTRPARATGVNDDGVVVGDTGHPNAKYVGDDGYAVRWGTDHYMTILKRLSGDATSHATGVNRFGEVSGSSGTHAVVWLPDGSVVRLATKADWQSSVANAVNRHGQVVGQAVEADGTQVAVYWKDASHVVVLGQLTTDDPDQNVFVSATATGINDAGLIGGWVLDYSPLGDYNRSLGVTWKP